MLKLIPERRQEQEAIKAITTTTTTEPPKRNDAFTPVSTRGGLERIQKAGWQPTNENRTEPEKSVQRMNSRYEGRKTIIMQPTGYIEGQGRGSTKEAELI